MTKPIDLERADASLKKAEDVTNESMRQALENIGVAISPQLPEAITKIVEEALAQMEGSEVNEALLEKIGLPDADELGKTFLRYGLSNIALATAIGHLTPGVLHAKARCMARELEKRDSLSAENLIEAVASFALETLHANARSASGAILTFLNALLKELIPEDKSHFDIVPEFSMELRTPEELVKAMEEALEEMKDRRIH